MNDTPQAAGAATPGKGRLILVPAPLDFGCDTQAPIGDVLPEATLKAAAALTHWVCENAKTARACLKRIGELHPLALPLQQQQIVEMPRELHKKGDTGAGFDAKPLLQLALQGHDIGLISEAGMPAIADPGASVVRAAHDLGLEVVPLVGPSSLLLALAASGLNGQSFAFVGYVPQETGAQAARLRELEALSRRLDQTQLLIETPYRNTALLRGLLAVLAPQTRLSVSCGLTMEGAFTRSDTVAGWRTRPMELPGDRPAVFALLAAR